METNPVLKPKTLRPFTSIEDIMSELSPIRLGYNKDEWRPHVEEMKSRGVWHAITEKEFTRTMACHLVPHISFTEVPSSRGHDWVSFRAEMILLSNEAFHEFMLRLEMFINQRETKAYYEGRDSGLKENLDKIKEIRDIICGGNPDET